MRKGYWTILGVVTVLGLIAALAVARDYRTGTVNLTKAKKGDGSAWLGVYTKTVDRALMRDLDLTVDKGELITDIVSDSPADKAGFEEDDVITAVDGTKVTDDRSLGDVISEHRPGDKVSITLLRDGKEKQILVALGDREDYDEPIIITGRAHNRPWTFSGRTQTYGFIGVSLTDLTRQLGTYFGVERGRGALISEVKDGSPAEAAGLRAGDVIVAIDDEKVTDVGDVQEMIRERKEGDKISVAVMRDRKPMTLTVEVEEHSGWGDLNSLRGAFAVAPVPPVPPVPRVKVWSRYNEAGDDYADRADLEEDLAQMREELRALSEQLSSDLVNKYEDVSKTEVEQLKREIEQLHKEVSRLH
ncbi:hypothetical protein C3F09_12205 [candidate division GN15 bacterium]|uniref:PDZ domain-containing protein n=1 Tax=candidate division GN15 bacterium TaxID=2072418 RepID=A0A855WZR0_9BACT|nr:MAG: hypothetical protein C3F09_12205 [candidate division GN15 bacterium]